MDVNPQGFNCPLCLGASNAGYEQCSRLVASTVALLASYGWLTLLSLLLNRKFDQVMLVLSRKVTMQAIQNFLTNYSANFHMALILWPILSALLTLPILAYLYHRDGRLRFSSMVGTYLSVLYVLGLGCFTLYPLPDGTPGPGITYGIEPNFNPLSFVNDIAKDGLKAVFQLVFNVLFFVPLGFIAGRLGRMKLIPTVLVGVATSALIEIAQLTGLFGLYPFAYRCCDVDDLICNTLGAVIGWLLARLFSRFVPEPRESLEITKRPGLVRRVVALWIDLTLVWLGGMIAYSAITFLLRSYNASLAVELFINTSYTSSDVLELTWLVAFVIMEVIIPWFNNGSTLGGMFVRMTCESRSRTPGRRLLFYVVRSATIIAIIWVPLCFIVIPVILMLYLANRRLPQDMVP